MRFQQADILPVALPVALKKVSFSLSLSHAHSLISARLFWLPKIFPKAWRAAFIYVALAVWECVHSVARIKEICACRPREMVLHWEGGPPQSTEGSQHHGCYLDHGAQRNLLSFTAAVPSDNQSFPLRVWRKCAFSVTTFTDFAEEHLIQKKKKKWKWSYLEVASITSRLLNGNTAGWQHRHDNEINLSRLQVQHGDALSLIRRFISVHLIQSAVLFKLSWFSALPVCHLVSGR